MELQRLAWDSDFFGFGVGRLVGSPESTEALEAVLNIAGRSEMRLAYGQCAHGDTSTRLIFLAAGGRQVDAKRTYARALTGRAQDGSAGGATVSGESAVDLRRLRSLAWQAAEFSRYRLDPRMPAGAWRRMYSIWIRNSLNGTLADAVLVERVESRIVGVATVKHRDEEASIGLLAVDRQFRGRGIAGRLLEAVRERAQAAGCTTLAVVTQGDNVDACALYERAGYSLFDEQDIFHFWIDPT